ncbi:hypothetical protein O181_102865 [Austropuccinia psidii MF-1]|uniref:Uncharacterized protein n=1 Tax=Austropuccinia psidii MF-1 TaxID=1389203 RepID=A0A9Q3PJ68_9BASI|nr:hypothetical protein [Austropuccinia psidii MF-1]
MSQYAEQTQQQFAELEASHERMEKLTASMDKIVKPLQEGHALLRKASEETNKRLNLVFEEQHHSKRDRDCMDKDINKLLNVYHNMKLQPQGPVMDNPYHQEDICHNHGNSSPWTSIWHILATSNIWEFGHIHKSLTKLAI